MNILKVDINRILYFMYEAKYIFSMWVALVALTGAINVVHAQTAQSAAEADYECAQIAKQQTGFDPESTPLPQATQSSGAPAGSAVRGAARGAIGGAVIGEIADDDAGRGAAIGAGVGAVRGRVGSSRQAQQQAAQQTQVNQQAYEQARQRYADAKSACMKAKGF